MQTPEKRITATQTVSQALEEAFTHHSQGNLAAAERLYEAILKVDADDIDALHLLGVVRKQQGRYDEAIRLIGRALSRDPDYVRAHVSLGLTLSDIKHHEDAIASYQRALAIDPGLAAVHYNIGVELGTLNRHEEAVASYQRALATKPDYAEAHCNLGVILTEMDRLAEAEASHRRALEIRPNYAGAHSNLGVTLGEQGRLAEAEASYRRALEIKPNYHEAHSNLGHVLTELGRLSEAESSCRRALEIKPDYAEAHSNLLFALNYAASHTSLYCLNEAREYGRRLDRKVGARFSSWQCVARPERLRVGLVSGDLHNHPVGYFLEGLLAHIDPVRVELIAYPTRHRADELTARIGPHFAAWKPLIGRSDEAAARMIHADGVHVLMDLSGHTAKNRLPVFAWKPAPVQVSWLGYFATTGVPEMDYLLADEVGVPEADREQFTETIWYLKDTRVCFTAPEICVAVAPLPALSKGNITFGCFQNLTKVGDEVLAAWGRIFAALPDARLRFQCKQLRDPTVGKRLARRLQQHGIDPIRAAMHASVTREAYLVAHAEVDLILDTFPYPGGTTTCEALWMGVPTLTLAGNTLLARQGASLLTAAGLPEWVAVSEADYVDKSIALAGDLPKLAALRAALRRQVLASPLFDAPRFARNFEAALWAMWHRWQGRR